MRAVEALAAPDGPFFVIAGPCVLESDDVNRRVAEHLTTLTARLRVPLLFKASYRKDNRTAGTSPRGPGIEDGLDRLARIREEFAVPVLSDVHDAAEATRAGEVLDVLQIPAFLCRQTSLLEAAAGTGRPLNIKKGQFLAPESMAHVVDKARAAGATAVAVTERGTCFGYGDLVVDPRSFPTLRGFGVRVVFDATHSLQRPGGSETGGDRRFLRPLVQAALAAGATAIFFETHPDPDRAQSDRGTQLALGDVAAFLEDVVSFEARVREARASV